MPGLDPQVVMHRLNIKLDAETLNSSNDDFDLILWRQLIPKFTNSSNVVSFKRNNT